MGTGRGDKDFVNFYLETAVFKVEALTRGRNDHFTAEKLDRQREKMRHVIACLHNQFSFCDRKLDLFDLDLQT